MRIYNVKAQDTLEGVSLKQYGLTTESARIASANPSIADQQNLKPGTILVIPDIDNASTNKNPATVTASNKDEVSLLIEGKIFTFWTDIFITRSMDTIGDTFGFRAAWTPDNPDYRRIFKPFQYQDVVVYLGGEKLITGTAINLNLTSAANRMDLNISGYSKPAVLNDVMAPTSAYPLEFSGMNLQQITETLVTPFGLGVVFKAPVGAAFSNVGLEPQQHIYQFLIDLAQQRGLVISSDTDGNLIYQQSTTEPPKSSIIEGKPPFISSNVIFDGQKRFSVFAALGDGWEKGEGQKAIVEDTAIKNAGVLRPMIYKAQDISAGDLNTAAIAKLGRSIADSIEIMVEVDSWRDREGNLWRDNQRVIFQAPGNMLYTQEEYIIRSVQYVKSPHTQTALLTLVFPESYSGEVRSSYPWD